MPKFRKKPVEIEAVRWIGSNHDQISDLHGNTSPSTVNFYGETGLRIGTLEGEHTATYGDWIIRDVQGELYPCKPDIFAATYDAV